MRKHFYTMQEWIDLDISSSETEVILGTPRNALVRPRTKNLIEAPEKSFKTTFTLRLMAGLSCGSTVFGSLPALRKRRVLYLHGELSPTEIQERTIAASTGLVGPHNNLIEGRTAEAHLISDEGQKQLLELIEEYTPEDVVLDPWQSFIAGSDENSFKEMSKATKFCDKLIDDFGVTLWIAIHLGKDRTRGARGHSTIAGWRDTLIRLVKEGAGVNVQVEPRWAKAPSPFRLKLIDGTLWPDGDVYPSQAQKYATSSNPRVERRLTLRWENI